MLKKYLSNYFEKNANRREIYAQLFLVLEILISKKREFLQRKGEYKLFNEYHWDEARDKAIDSYSKELKIAINDEAKAKKLIEGNTNYFKGIHYFKIVDVYNKLKKTPISSLDEQPVSVAISENKEQENIINEREENVRWALSALPYKQRICLFYKGSQKMTHEEVAQKVGLPSADSARKGYAEAIKNFPVIYEQLEKREFVLLSKENMQTLDYLMTVFEEKIKTLESQIKKMKQDYYSESCFEVAEKKRIEKQKLLYMLNSSFFTLKDTQQEIIKDIVKQKTDTTTKTESIFIKWNDAICFYLEFFHQNKS